MLLVVGISIVGETELKFYDTLKKLEFLASSPNNFKPGLNYTGIVC